MAAGNFGILSRCPRLGNGVTFRDTGGKRFFLGSGYFDISKPHICSTLGYSLNISCLFYFDANVFPKSIISVLSGPALI